MKFSCSTAVVADAFQFASYGFMEAPKLVKISEKESKLESEEEVEVE